MVYIGMNGHKTLSQTAVYLKGVSNEKFRPFFYLDEQIYICWILNLYSAPLIYIEINKFPAAIAKSNRLYNVSCLFLVNFALLPIGWHNLADFFLYHLLFSIG